MESSKDLILLYDGMCGFCNSTIQLIIRHDKKGSIRFAALQSRFASKVIERHPYLKSIDSLILIESNDSPEERIFIRSTGALVIARYLNGWWTLFLIGYLIPPFIRDWFYDTFARYRYRLFGTLDCCLLPPPEVRSRFLDLS